jgi:hypothetical protein
MKVPKKIAVSVSFSMLLVAVGCSKQDENSAPTTPSTNASASATEMLKEKASEVAATVKEKTEAATQAAQQTAAKVQTEVAVQTKAAQEAVTTQAATLDSKVKAVVAKAQQLYSEGKFNDALTSLNTLAAENLSAENQAMVSRLKEQVQTALKGAANLTDKASKGVSGLLQPQ